MHRAVRVREFPEAPVSRVSVQHIPTAARITEPLEPLTNQPIYALRDRVPSELPSQILFIGMKIVVHALRFPIHRITLHSDAAVESSRGRRSGYKDVQRVQELLVLSHERDT